MAETIKGTIDKIVYLNEDNGFAVVRLLSENSQELTAVGNMYPITEGEVIQITGDWIKDKKYGKQFKVQSYETKRPNTTHAMEKYLSSSLIKGIGPKYAKRIVDTYGEETFDIIENKIGLLQKIPGIGRKTVEKIYNAWNKHKPIKDLMLKCQEYGISPAYALKIYRTYEEKAFDVLKDNPYQLADDIWGIGFKTADKIATKMGIHPQDPKRIQAFILYYLGHKTEQGHVFLPRKELIEKIQQELSVVITAMNEDGTPLETQINITQEETEEALESLKIQEKIIETPFENTTAVYKTALYHCEQGAANHIKRLLKSPSSIPMIKWDKAIVWFEQNYKMTLGDEQKQALITLGQSKMIIITGGPGTGKTTLVKAIISIIGKKTSRIMLCAPTGRAAKRLSETTGMQAKTIHRLLEFSPGNGGYVKNKSNPLKTDLLIVDEFSMVDITLFYRLLEAVHDHTTLVLVGDKDQLPSVGPGNVLSDLLDYSSIPRVILQFIYRQAKKSQIVTHAHSINKGFIPNIINHPEKTKSDFYFIPCEEADRVVEKILDYCHNRIPKTFGFDPFSDIQVITPMNRGETGAFHLNQQLQGALNSNPVFISKGMHQYHTGDKVMQLRNNYDKDVYNGDIGIIQWIDLEDQKITVLFDGRKVYYEENEMDELTLSYAITVHKSQGSEYPAVVIPILTQHYVMLARNLIYTAITRGKKLVVLIGSKKALAMAIKNDTRQKRYTRLTEELKNTAIK